VERSWSYRGARSTPGLRISVLEEADSQAGYDEVEDRFLRQ
jgi:hypothetical protein